MSATTKESHVPIQESTPADDPEIPECRLRVYREAQRLAVLAFDAEVLNRDRIVLLEEGDMAYELEGWEAGLGWKISVPALSFEGYAQEIGCVCDYRYFADFLIGIRGRVIAQSGDSSAVDAEKRFARFEAVGGVFGSRAAAFVGMGS